MHWLNEWIDFFKNKILMWISDPHIKIIGLPDDVKIAKEEILTILDTKV